MTKEYRCSKCEQHKPESDFHRRGANRGRPVAYSCKTCLKESDKKRGERKKLERDAIDIQKGFSRPETESISSSYLIRELVA